jgi:hypothetical protein
VAIEKKKELEKKRVTSLIYVYFGFLKNLNFLIKAFKCNRQTQKEIDSFRTSQRQDSTAPRAGFSTEQGKIIYFF